MGIIRIGDAAPSLLRLGDTEAYAAYAGDERVWPGTETKLWLHLTNLTKSVVIYGFSYTGYPSWQIDWGDGQKELVSGRNNASHAYKGTTARDFLVRFKPQANIRSSLGNGLSMNIFGKDEGENKVGTSPELVRVEIGGYADEIASWVFSGCMSLALVTVPSSVLSLGQGVFKSCAGLVLAEIGARRLGTHVLKDCPALQKLWLRESVETIGADSLRDIGPMGALTIYCEADEKPASWPEGWNPGGFPVVWGQKVRPW